MHNRRDKRWPFYAERSDRAAVGSTSAVAEFGGEGVGLASDAEHEVSDREVLRLWLKWNAAYEQIAVFMTQPEMADSQRLEEMIDQLDQMRLNAAKLSSQLVEDMAAAR